LADRANKSPPSRSFARGSNTGALVTDPGNSLTIPRVQLNAATDTIDACLPPPADIIVDADYVDPVASVISGSFSSAANTLAYRGAAREGVAGTLDTFRFTPTLASSGNYEIYAWWPSSATLSNQAVYSIKHADSATPTDVLVDQSAGGGNWTSLDNFALAADGSDYVEISNPNGGTVSADAVRFEFLQSPAFVSIDTPTLPNASTNVPYTAALQSSCVAAPATWAIISGTLPPGLGIDPNTGVISGTPTAVVPRISLTDCGRKRRFSEPTLHLDYHRYSRGTNRATSGWGDCSSIHDATSGSEWHSPLHLEHSAR